MVTLNITVSGPVNRSKENITIIFLLQKDDDAGIRVHTGASGEEIWSAPGKYKDGKSHNLY